ncbi:hypothetical protein Tco_0401656 [Tanacetum coccineum]
MIGGRGSAFDASGSPRVTPAMVNLRILQSGICCVLGIQHLEGIWRKYTLLRLIWRRNGQDYEPTPTSLKNFYLAAGDGVTDNT